MLVVFCQDKAMTVISFHRCLVYDDHICAPAFMTATNSWKRQLKEEPGSVKQKMKQSCENFRQQEEGDSELKLEEESGV